MNPTFAEKLTMIKGGAVALTFLTPHNTSSYVGWSVRLHGYCDLYVIQDDIDGVNVPPRIESTSLPRYETIAQIGVFRDLIGAVKYMRDHNRPFWGIIKHKPNHSKVFDRMIIDMATGRSPFLQHIRKALFSPYLNMIELDMVEKFGPFT